MYFCRMGNVRRMNDDNNVLSQVTGEGKFCIIFVGRYEYVLRNDESLTKKGISERT